MAKGGSIAIQRKGGEVIASPPLLITSAGAIYLDSVYVPDNTPLVLSQVYEVLYNVLMLTE